MLRGARAASLGLTLAAVSVAGTSALGVATAFLASPPTASAATALRPGQSPLPSASSLVAATRRAMLAARSVHLDLVERGPGANETIVGDAGLERGRQELRSGKAWVQIRLTPTRAYFRGDQSGLRKALGMPAADIRRAGSRWVAVDAGTSAYRTFKANLLISGLPSAFLPSSGHVTVSHVTVDGEPADRLSWSFTSSGKQWRLHLDVAATGRRLPIAESGTAGKDRQRATFSRWGELVAVAVPHDTVPFTKVTG